MQSTLSTSTGPAVQVPVMVAAELQDSLLVVMHDLHRLEGLLNHATDNLLERFGEANAALNDAFVGDAPELEAARAALRSAVTELQFQDMASQLIVHISRVLQGCAFRLASESMGHFSRSGINGVKQLKGLQFRELFLWLSASMQVVSQSTPGGKAQLPPTDSWSEISV